MNTLKLNLTLNFYPWEVITSKNDNHSMFVVIQLFIFTSIFKSFTSTVLEFYNQSSVTFHFNFNLRDEFTQPLWRISNLDFYSNSQNAMFYTWKFDFPMCLSKSKKRSWRMNYVLRMMVCMENLWNFFFLLSCNDWLSNFCSSTECEKVCFFTYNASSGKSEGGEILAVLCVYASDKVPWDWISTNCFRVMQISCIFGYQSVTLDLENQ